MPNITLYIKNEDIDRWRRLKGKAPFVSKHLNEYWDKIEHKEKKKELYPEISAPEISVPEISATEIPKAPEKKVKIYCEHAYPKDKCSKCKWA
jgi:hypothetical protein